MKSIIFLIATCTISCAALASEPTQPRDCEAIRPASTATRFRAGPVYLYVPSNATVFESVLTNIEQGGGDAKYLQLRIPGVMGAEVGVPTEQGGTQEELAAASDHVFSRFIEEIKGGHGSLANLERRELAEFGEIWRHKFGHLHGYGFTLSYSGSSSRASAAVFPDRMQSLSFTFVYPRECHFHAKEFMERLLSSMHPLQ